MLRIPAPSVPCLAALLTTLVASLITTGAAAQDWPTYRGADGSGSAPNSSPPIEFGEQTARKWKVPVPGTGHSSPIVTGDLIVMTTAIKGADVGRNPDADPENDRAPTHEHEFRVLAFDRETGAERWSTLVRTEVPHEGKHPDGTYASPTPIAEDGRLYAFFGSRGLYCLDLDGNLIWETDLGNMQSHGQLGEGATIALSASAVIVPWDHRGDSFVAAIDKQTGSELWRTERPSDANWAPPAIATVNGQEQAILPGVGACIGYNADTGEEIWRVTGFSASAIPKPIITGDTCILTAAYDRSMMIAVDLPDANGDITDTDAVKWTFNRVCPYVPTPVLIDDRLVFLRKTSGMVSCVNTDDGSRVYFGKRLGQIGDVYASPVAGGGHIYICAREGDISVIKDGSEFEVVATTKLDGAINATPAISGTELFIRTDTSLYCFTSASAN